MSAVDTSFICMMLCFLYANSSGDQGWCLLGAMWGAVCLYRAGKEAAK